MLPGHIEAASWSAPGAVLGSGGSDRFLQGGVPVGSGRSEGGVPLPPNEYDQFLADVWVGVVLTLMVFSCLCCMCSCMLYHRFQEWKRGGKYYFITHSSLLKSDQSKKKNRNSLQ